MFQMFNRNSRVMETGDHFKNGASPKSQTSKVKKFRLINVRCYILQEISPVYKITE
jgi:hypothetical protein